MEASHREREIQRWQKFLKSFQEASICSSSLSLSPSPPEEMLSERKRVNEVPAHCAAPPLCVLHFHDSSATRLLLHSLGRRALVLLSRETTWLPSLLSSPSCDKSWRRGWCPRSLFLSLSGAKPKEKTNVTHKLNGFFSGGGWGYKLLQVDLGL